MGYLIFLICAIWLAVLFPWLLLIYIGIIALAVLYRQFIQVKILKLNIYSMRLTALIGGIVTAVLVGHFTFQNQENVKLAVGAFDDPFVSIQLATDPDNGECLTTDGSNNVWSTSCGSSMWMNFDVITINHQPFIILIINQLFQ